MEWTDIRLTVAKADAENAEAVATLIAEGGIYIEDYSDIEQQVAEIAHVDLIEQELLDKPRDTVIIHLYLEPGASQVETLALIAARMEAAGIPYTVETEGVEQEDWQNGWRKYYHPMDVGQRLAIVPSWQDYDTDRVKLILDPGLAFGTGGHETTNLCLEVLDEPVKGGERVLDIGTGTIVALDGIAIIVNKDSKVEDLTVDQLRQMFTGEITNWKDVGGDDGEIVLVGREAGSGTRDGFESIVDVKDSCKYAQELTATGAVISAVEANPLAIGYASLSAVGDTVKMVTVGGVECSEETVKDGSYEVQRPFVFVTNKSVTLSEQAQAFFDFATSADAADLIRTAGAVPVNE